MPSSLFCSRLQKIGFAWYFLFFGTGASAGRPLSIYPPAHPLAVGGNMLSPLFVAGYEKIGFAWHFLFSGPLRLPARWPPSIFAPAHSGFCHPGEVV